MFGNMSKAGGIANNIAPTYRDGAMFANDNEFYLYGYFGSPFVNSRLTCIVASFVSQTVKTLQPATPFSAMNDTSMAQSENPGNRASSSTISTAA
jgi:hypothetical protein